MACPVGVKSPGGSFGQLRAISSPWFSAGGTTPIGNGQVFDDGTPERSNLPLPNTASFTKLKSPCIAGTTPVSTSSSAACSASQRVVLPSIGYA